MQGDKGEGDVIVDEYDEWSTQADEEFTDFHHDDEPLNCENGIKCEGGWDDDAADKSDCTSVDLEEDGEDSWDDELQSFLEESPEFRAKIQYQVRIVALMPGFQAGGRKVAGFSHFYKLRFGKSLLETTGFSSAEVLCKSMPHVIQRQLLDEKSEVVLVESAKNMRVVAGIRSGLRRIVYDILKLHPKGLSARALDEECSKSIGRPLTMVLTELAYDTPNVECMVRDIADIANFKQACGGNKVFLSSEAEDPALTDGILIGIPPKKSSTTISGTGVEGSLNKYKVANDDVLQVRFRLIVLLALHSGGIEIDRLQKAYAEMYTDNLDPRLLGFSSMEDVVRSWTDVVLVQESIPQKAFLRPSQGNRQLLHGLQSGLRSSVFEILLARYPDGLEPSEVLNQLQESHSGQLLEVLNCHGYAAGSLEGLESMEDLQLVQLHMLCFLVHDMMDFARFGCRDDGSLVLKLRDTGFPVLDFPECNQDDEFVKLLSEGEDHKTLKVDASPPADDSAALDEADTVFLEEMQVDVPEALEHQIRLILGSLENGLPLEDFVSVYKQRTGQSLTVNELRSFVSTRPGILRMTKSSLLQLVESPKNLRIISATKAGLRQVLYWALLKNPGGVWSELLEGWFADFTGYPLTDVLVRHGYPASDREPLLPVSEFLEDMSDLCQLHKGRLQFYVLVGGSIDDPVEKDGSLLGLSCAEIEYDPVRLCTELVHEERPRLEDGERSEISIEQEVPFLAGGDSSSVENEEPFLAGGDSGSVENEEECASLRSWDRRLSAEYDPPKAYASLN